MGRPVIITTGAHVITEDGYRQNLLWQAYMDGILIGDGLPLLVTDVDQDAAAQLARQTDGLFLSGGKDVSPQCYAEEKHSFCGANDKKRDLLEFELIRAFLGEHKPILAICRGCQVVNVFFGGTLYQDIKAQTGFEHPYGSIHDVEVTAGSVLHNLFGESFTVNSLHHQAIHRLGKGLVPVAYAENGPFVEAYVHEEFPIIATQFHPERMTGEEPMTPVGPDMAPLMRHFIHLCKRQM